MNRADELLHENELLRDRLSRLSEASIQITANLDLDTVLQGVVDGACSLTGARIGGITILDDAGQPPELITSGLTAEERQRFVDLPGGLEFFQYLSMLPEPLRLADFSGHTRAAGLPEIGPPLGPVKTFLGTPIRLRDEHVGNLYLAEKEGGGEFTGADEEILVMFASQAALVIANARRHREEQRARADLETLVDTSPVGVVAFDARTGRVVSLNQEAKRIVGDLRMPDRSPEQLLDVLTFRRADGREISLKEFPLAQALSTGETVRAEEIVIQVPDGRSVTTIINATPIRSQEGELESVVVTLQDMTPLEELERLRAEFLAMVGHELRTPLTSIRGSVVSLMDRSLELDPAEMHQFFRIIEEQSDNMRDLISDLLDVAYIETGLLTVAPEPAAVAVLLDRARSAFLSGGGENIIHIDLPLDLPQVLADRRRIVQVLGNLLSNASRYSPARSTIHVTVVRENVHVAICVADEGKGVPAERLPHLFRKFSRINGEAREFRGSGLGLAICKGIVEAHGGRIWAESDGADLGTRFTFTLPLVAEPVLAESATRREHDRLRPNKEKPTRILAVDDDPHALRYVRNTLSQAGYTPVVTGDPAEVAALIEKNKPHLVLLDLVFPGTDGIELMERTPALADLPVIFLSAYGRDQTIAKALEMGAADYLVKPFSPTELVARIQAALRRREAPERIEPSKPYVLAELTIDYAQRLVTVAGRPVQLTATEYDLLAELSAHAGRVLTHNHLLQRVWRQITPGDARVIRTHLKRLRRKLGDDAENPTYIFTTPRVGYRMAQAEEPDETTP